jgi:hypothetical protein
MRLTEELQRQTGKPGYWFRLLLTKLADYETEQNHLECADPSALLVGCDLSQPVGEWHSTENDGDGSPITTAVTGHRTPNKAPGSVFVSAYMGSNTLIVPTWNQ